MGSRHLWYRHWTQIINPRAFGASTALDLRKRREGPNVGALIIRIEFWGGVLIIFIV